MEEQNIDHNISNKQSDDTVQSMNSDNHKWYIISSSSGKENKTAQLIKQRIKANSLDENVSEVIVPMQEKIVIKRGKKQTIEERIFPGYILVKMAASDDVLHLMRNTEGVLGFVGMTATSKTPTPLNAKEAEGILAFTKVKQSPVYNVNFSIGDAVRVVEGPFKDFVGTIQDINESKGQVTVLLSIFDRETPVQLDFLQVNKI
jgi:transcription termination/antitermination protein NusG